MLLVLVSAHSSILALSLVHLRHALHPRHSLTLSLAILHIRHVLHTWNTTHELLKVGIVLSDILLVHVLEELCIRSLIILLIIESLLLVKLSTVLSLTRVYSMLSLTLILCIVRLRSHVISLLIWVSTSVCLGSTLLLHVSPLILLLLVVLLLPLVLLGLVLILLASPLPVNLRVNLLVHRIVLIITMGTCFEICLNVVT